MNSETVNKTLAFTLFILYNIQVKFTYFKGEMKMKKRILSLFLTVLLCILAVTMVISCGDDEETGDNGSTKILVTYDSTGKEISASSYGSGIDIRYCSTSELAKM